MSSESETGPKEGVPQIVQDLEGIRGNGILIDRMLTHITPGELAKLDSMVFTPNNIAYEKLGTVLETDTADRLMAEFRALLNFTDAPEQQTEWVGRVKKKLEEANIS